MSASKQKKTRTDRHFAKSKNAAARITADPAEAAALVARGMKKASRHKDALKKGWEDLTGMMRLVKAWTSGSYKDVPVQTIVLAVAAVAYFVSPIDAIPDFIPVAGFLDDVTVIGLVISSIRGDVAQFRKWEGGA